MEAITIVRIEKIQSDQSVFYKVLVNLLLRQGKSRATMIAIQQTPE
jgi:hypothetical protein